MTLTEQVTLNGERIDRPDDFQPKLYTLWSFHKRDPRYGSPDYKWGGIAGQIVENLLYYYAKDGDIVLDPMAGSGTALDVCKAWSRHCLAYDIGPVRPDIKHNDITKGLPHLVPLADLVILEPPYFNMKVEAYESFQDFLRFLRLVVIHSVIGLRPGGYIALIMMDQVNKGPQKYPLVGKAFEILAGEGLEFVNNITLPLSTQQFPAFQVARCKDRKGLMGISRQIWVFRKPEGSAE